MIFFLSISTEGSAHPYEVVLKLRELEKNVIIDKMNL